MEAVGVTASAVAEEAPVPAQDAWTVWPFVPSLQMPLTTT